MRKTKWKLWIVMLVVFLLAACSGANEGGGSSESAGSDSTTSPQQEAGEEQSGGEEPVQFSISMRTLNVPYVESHPNINEDDYVLELEKRTNVDLDIILVPHNQFQEKMIQMFSVNDIPDVVQANGGLYGTELAGAVQSGVFLPLNDLLEEYGQDLLENVPEAAWARVTDSDGTIWAIPEYLANPSRRATWIRKDLLDKVGMDVPRTVEETLDVLRAFKEIGVEHPYAGRANFKYADTFFGAYDVFGYTNQFKLFPDGQVKPSFFDVENMKAAIQVYKTMYEEGLISPEFPTIGSTDFRMNATGGKAGMWVMNANELPIWEAQLKENVPGAEVQLIPSPVGPDGKGGYAHYGQVPRAFFINKDAADKAPAIIKFFNWMVSEEAELFFSFGIEGVDYEVVNGEPVFEVPEDTDGVNKLRYLNYWLWMVHDTTYNRLVSSLSETGRQMIDAFDNILAKEGRIHIEFDPPLEGWVKYPDLRPKSDEMPPLILEGVMQMVFGVKPIDYLDDLLDEYLAKGGQEIIDEATKRYHENINVFKWDEMQ